MDNQVLLRLAEGVLDGRVENFELAVTVVEEFYVAKLASVAESISGLSLLVDELDPFEVPSAFSMRALLDEMLGKLGS